MDIKTLFEKMVSIQSSEEDNKLRQKFDVRDRDIKVAAKEMADYWGTDVSHMVYAFIWDPGFAGKVWITFNITDPNNRYYKSSKNYVWLPKNERGVKKER